MFVNVPERPQPAPCTIAPNNGANGTPGLPKDLPPGCLLRIGPNGASRNMGFLDGDGLVHCITLPPPGDSADGAADNVPRYSSTYVDTKGRKLENAKDGDATFAGTLGAAPQGLPMLAALVRNGITFGTLDLQKDTCNTALAVSGGRILALMEQSPPSEIEFTKEGRMRTVESFARLNGAVPEGPINGGSFGAHGRTDPKTGERVHVSYNSNSRPFVRIDTFAEDWKLTSSVGVDVPAPVMVHDCALTKNYVVILDFPLTIRPRRFLANVFPVEYEPDNGARIGLTPRGGDTDKTLWFDVESGVVLHAANAYEREDGMVVIHGFKSVPGGISCYILDYTPSFLYQWILDPATGKTMNERCLNPNVMVEFPQVEDRLSGDKADATYGLVSTSIGGPSYFKTPEEGVLLNAAVKFALIDDADNGLVAGDVLSRFDLPPGWHMVSEPTVVTKTGGDGHYVLLVATYVPSANDDNDDDEKYIKVATDGKSMKSQLLVLDGNCISDGPVTTVDLPYHMNYGLHSMFLEWDKMKS
jgi:carotenoid cleavage dioxygenase-like enzyme